MVPDGDRETAREDARVASRGDDEDDEDGDDRLRLEEIRDDDTNEDDGDGGDDTVDGRW